MKLGGSATLSRFTSVVAARRPHLANGFVCRVAARKIGSNNPLLELLRIPRDASMCHPDEYSISSSALMYDRATVRYAALALPHLVTNGLTRAYAHLNRVLDVIITSRDELVSLEPRILRDILVACDAIRHHHPRSSFRSMPHKGSTPIFNVVMEKSLECVCYISEAATVFSGPQDIADFALVMSRMGLHSDAFTMRVLHMANDATSCSPESLVGTLEYLMEGVRQGVRGCMGAFYSIVDALVDAAPGWSCSMRVLDCMARSKVIHTPFVERITESLITDVECSQGDLIGMDTVSSRDLCRLVGALLQLECIHLEAIMETFLSRYIPSHKGRLKQGGIYRDIRRCSLKDLVNLLTAIVRTQPTVEGAAMTWSKYIVQQKVPFKLSLTSTEDIKMLFEALSSLDSCIYYDVLRPSREAHWIYGVGKVNVTTILASTAPLLGPHALANAVLCYSVSRDAMTDDTTRKVVLECIRIMCAHTLDMLLRSSLITRSTIERLLSVDGDRALILVGSSGSTSSPMVEAITHDHKSNFLYDPSVNTNFKYLKRGENRYNGLKLLSKGFGLHKGSAPDEVISAHFSPKDFIDETAETAEGCITSHSTSSESASKLLKVVRHVYRSLCMYHHFGGMGSVVLYDGLSVAGLQTVQGFLKVYDHVITLFSSRFSDVDTESTVYGIDKLFESRLKKALRTNDTNYLDPRFICTPDVYALHKSQEGAQTRLRFSDARLRSTGIGLLKPPKSKIRLNWSHFYEANELYPDVRARGPRKASARVHDEVARVSREVDNLVHGSREAVEYYEDFVSRHFRGGFAFVANSCRASGSESSNVAAAGLSSSRMQKQVMQVAIVSGLGPVPEFRCGPYYVDIHCGRPNTNGGMTRAMPVRR
ncbi:hypothetical protein X943_003064 [Babesia divergens]|uniref:Uncharacterized protein n=1 Tax=Babesia divergens TaxID=32595 RepID=A0AAD9LFX3_BABDI|nr:hypothetical protein X943_003064 [Babesia divergens]